MIRFKTSIVGAVALALACAAPGVATAKSKPPKASVATGGVASKSLTPNSVIVRGAVRPNGAETSYVFQYGTTKKYELTTPPTPVGSGGKLLNVTAGLTGLAPATTYHYRLVATNKRGTTRGKDRSFKTKKEPLGIVLNADANPVAAGQLLNLTGAVSGTDKAGRRVTLQQKPFPYTADWTPVLGINDVFTGADGVFAFRALGVPFNTQYRVVVAGKDVASPIVSEGVKPHITTKAPRKARRTGKHKRFAHFRFSGTITPNRDGSQVLVQKFIRGVWTTIGATSATHGSDTQSRYSKRVRQRHGGSYRVVVNPIDGAFVPNTGSTKKIHVTKR